MYDDPVDDFFAKLDQEGYEGLCPDLHFPGDPHSPNVTSTTHTPSPTPPTPNPSNSQSEGQRLDEEWVDMATPTGQNDDFWTNLLDPPVDLNLEDDMDSERTISDVDDDHGVESTPARDAKMTFIAFITLYATLKRAGLLHLWMASSPLMRVLVNLGASKVAEASHHNFLKKFRGTPYNMMLSGGSLKRDGSVGQTSGYIFVQPAMEYYLEWFTSKYPAVIIELTMDRVYMYATHNKLFKANALLTLEGSSLAVPNPSRKKLEKLFKSLFGE